MIEDLSSKNLLSINYVSIDNGKKEEKKRDERIMKGKKKKNYPNIKPQFINSFSFKELWIKYVITRQIIKKFNEELTKK